MSRRETQGKAWCNFQHVADEGLEIDVELQVGREINAYFVSYYNPKVIPNPAHQGQSLSQRCKKRV